MKFVGIAEIISTANARANIVEHKQPGAPANMTPAGVVFTKQCSVFLGGKEVRAEYFGRGHTNGDAVIYFPALRTIHTGDLMADNYSLDRLHGRGKSGRMDEDSRRRVETRFRHGDSGAR